MDVNPIGGTSPVMGCHAAWEAIVAAAASQVLPQSAVRIESLGGRRHGGCQARNGRRNFGAVPRVSAGCLQATKQLWLRLLRRQLLQMRPW